MINKSLNQKKKKKKKKAIIWKIIPKLSLLPLLIWSTDLPMYIRNALVMSQK